MSDNLKKVRTQFLAASSGLLTRELRRLEGAGSFGFDDKPFRIGDAAFVEAAAAFVPVRKAEIDFVAFDAWWQANDYGTRFPNYTKTYADPALLEKKAFEHWISLEETKGGPRGAMMDVGCATSPFADLVTQDLGSTCSICYRSDLPLPEYGFRPGIHGNVIGCNAASVPLPDGALSRIFSHGAVEHFEGDSFAGFFREAARLLQSEGTLFVVPLSVGRKTFTYTSIAGIYRRLSFPQFLPNLEIVYSDKIGQPYSLRIDADFLRTRIVEPLSGSMDFELIHFQNHRERKYGVQLALKGTRR